MAELTTEITLEAPVDRIWQLLTDFGLYPQWNPLFTKATGPVNPGERFDLVVKLPGMDPFPIKPVLQEAEPKSRLSWQSSMLSSALLSWTFCYELHSLSPDRLRLTQRSSFKGLLSPLFSFAMKKPVTDGMQSLNDALKRWGEKGNVRCMRC